MRCVFPKAYDRHPGVDRTLAVPAPTCVPVPFAFPQPSGLMRFGRFLWAPLHAAVALLAPGECRICALPLTHPQACPVCEDCLAGIASQPLTTATCFLCGDALGMEPGWGLAKTEQLRCDGCHEAEPHFRRAVSFGHYGGPLRALIHLHKFEHMTHLARPLGHRLAGSIAGFQPETPDGLTIIAVPLFRRRRPFNQSAALADVAVQRLRRDLPHWPLRTGHDLLQRTRPTQSQSQLTPAQRRSNVRGAFAVCGDVRGRDLLLVDDVYTTGATVGECTRVLLRAGAASVRVATLARATREMVAGWDTFSSASGERVTQVPADRFATHDFDRERSSIRGA